MDNLESQTYEVFEKDPIKYSQYQQVRADTQAVVTLESNQYSMQFPVVSVLLVWTLISG